VIEVRCGEKGQHLAIDDAEDSPREDTPCNISSKQQRLRNAGICTNRSEMGMRWE
jgi:hypothetical protein